MPQASDKVVNEYFKEFGLTEHDDMPALRHLTGHELIKHHRGIFYYSDEAAKRFSNKTWAAINYLVDEWDCGTGYLKDFPVGQKHQIIS